MNFDRVRINLSFEIEHCSIKDLAKIHEIINFGGQIDNKEFLEFFSLDKRPLVTSKVEKKEEGEIMGLESKYKQWLTEIDIIG